MSKLVDPSSSSSSAGKYVKDIDPQPPQPSTTSTSSGVDKEGRKGNESNDSSHSYPKLNSDSSAGPFRMTVKDVAKNPALAKLLVLAAKKMKAHQQKSADG